MPYMPLLRTILLQVALGMQYLHAHGLIHGELRADNVLIQGALPPLPDLPNEGSQQQDGGQQDTAAAAAAAAAGGGGGFVLKVKDIGMCHLVTAARAVTVKKLVGRSRMNSVGWLPPECFRGEPLGKQGDVYAFGILMWELYTGQVRRGGLRAARGRGGMPLNY
jgi:serine/threonine protein kinase